MNNEFSLANEETREIMAKDKGVKYAHFNVNNGQATVGGLKVDNTLFYWISICSPLDNFSRQIGREKAGKFLTEPVSSNKRGVLNITGFADRSYGELLRMALERHLDKMRNKPSWLRRPVISFRGKYRKK